MDDSLEGRARSIPRALLAFCKAPDRQTATASSEKLAVRAESNAEGLTSYSARRPLCYTCAVPMIQPTVSFPSE